MRILVVEDEATVADSIEALLVSHHYAVDIARDGLEGLEMTEFYRYDLMVLDIGLPKIDGLNLCQQIRQRQIQTPILLLTGQVVEAHAKAIALNTGADDYVTKPFDVEELLARIQTLLRRGNLTAPPVLRWGELSLDPSRLQVTYGTDPLRLTPKEYSLLEVLLRNAPHILSTHAILEQGWNALEAPGDETIRTHIKELRKKLKAVGSPPDFIKTVHGQGYRLNPQYGETTTTTPEASIETLQTALSQSEALYRTLFNSIDVGFHMVELIYNGTGHAVDYRFLEGNKAFERQTGLKNVVGKLGSAIAPERESYWLAVYEEVVETGESLRLEIYHEPTDRWYSADALQVSATNKQQVAVLFADITEAKQQGQHQAILAAISQELAQLKTIATTMNALGEMIGRYFRATHCLFVELSADYEVAMAEYGWNAAGFASLKASYYTKDCFSDAQLAANFTGEITVVDDTQTVPWVNQSCCETLGIRSFVMVPIVCDRSWRFMLTVIDHQPRQWRNDEVALMQEMATRIWTRLERARTEEALIKQDELLRLALAGAQAGSWSWNLVTDEIHCSDETFALYGLNPVDNIPDYETWFEQFLHPDDRDRLHDYLQQVLRDKSPQLKVEFRILHPTKNVRWLLSLGHLTCDEQGEPLRFNGICIDISDRKWAETEMTEDLRDTQRLHDLSTRLTTATDIQALYDEILATAIAITRADAGTVQLCDPNSQDLLLLAAQGFDATLTEYLSVVATHTANCTNSYCLARQTGDRSFVDFDAYPDTDVHDWRTRYFNAGYRSAQSTPLVTRSGKVIGMVSTHWRNHHRPGDRELRFLDLLVRQAADLIEQRQAEAALHESEQRLRLFVQYAPANVAMFDREMRYIAVSQRWLETYQLGSMAAVLGKSAYELLPIPDRWQQIAQRCLEGISEKCAEDQFTLPDGTQQWLKWEVQPWRTVTGEVGGILCFVEDITAQKQVAFMLQQQIRQEYLLADIAQEIRQSLDLDQILQSTVNRVRQWLNGDRVLIYRFSPDWSGEVVMESVGDRWLTIQSASIVDPCFKGKLVEPYRQGYVSVLNDINQVGLERCYVELLAQFQVQASLAVPILQGDTLWGLLIAHQCDAPRQWQPEEIAFLKRLTIQVGIALQQSELYAKIQADMTLQQQATQQIQQQATLLDIATDAIFVRDMQHHILYWNHGAERLFGWTADEVLGKRADHLLHRDPAHLAAAMNTLLTHDTWQGEIPTSTKSGEQITVYARWTLVRDTAGQPQSILSVKTDITDKKRLEAQFYQSQRLESLGTLASGIAHDLNNMLTPVLTMAQLLRLTQKGLDAKGLNQLQLIESSARRGSNLVKQILSVTRASQGEQRAVDIAALLQEETEIVRQSFPKTIQIQVDVPPSTSNQPALGTILADPTYLHQILLNLCINARDAMPDGGTLTIAASQVFIDEAIAAQHLDAHADHYVMIRVTDTGTGIPPAVQERMFDPFFTTKDHSQGTGLGLATVRNLVKANQGFMEVTSQVGQGTTFKIYLPLMATETLEAIAPPVTTPPPVLEPSETAVLIAEDEADLRHILISLLETQNYHIIPVKNGVDALEQYRQHQEQIRLVVTDLMMPIMDGFTLIEQLKTIQPQLPIIALSGVPFHEEIARAAGASSFVAKPFDVQTILSQIEQLLQITPQTPALS